MRKEVRRRSEGTLAPGKSSVVSCHMHLCMPIRTDLRCTPKTQIRKHCRGKKLYKDKLTLGLVTASSAVIIVSFFGSNAEIWKLQWIFGSDTCVCFTSCGCSEKDVRKLGTCSEKFQRTQCHQSHTRPIDI